MTRTFMLKPTPRVSGLYVASRESRLLAGRRWRGQRGDPAGDFGRSKFLGRACALVRWPAAPPSTSTSASSSRRATRSSASRSARSTGSDAVLSRIAADGPAAGWLCEGDAVLAVGGVEVSGPLHAAQLLRESVGEFIVTKCSPLSPEQPRRVPRERLELRLQHRSAAAARRRRDAAERAARALRRDGRARGRAHQGGGEPAAAHRRARGRADPAVVADAPGGGGAALRGRRNHPRAGGVPRPLGARRGAVPAVPPRVGGADDPGGVAPPRFHKEAPPAQGAQERRGAARRRRPPRGEARDEAHALVDPPLLRRQGGGEG